ncbi:MAG: MFS transporter [Acidobacteriota bacterium]
MRTRRSGPVFATGLLFGILFLASADNQLLIPLLPRLSEDLSVSVARLGGLFSIYALSAAIFNLILGPLTDRLGRVLFLRTGLAAFVVLALLTTQTGGYGSLLVFRAGMGIAAGLLSTCTASYVGDAFPYESRGRIMGFVLSSYFAALILGVPLSSWIAESWGWRNVFGVVAVLAGALLLGAFLLRQDRPETPVRGTGGFAGLLPLLSGRETAGALATSFLISGGTLAFLTFISGFLNDVYDLGPTRISLIFLVSGVAAITASPISGWLSDRWTKRRVFLAANTLLAVPLLALDRIGCGAGLFAGVFLIGLFISFRQTALQTLQTGLIGEERRGAFLALRNASSQLGISVSVLAAGALYSSLGYRGVTVLAAGLTLLGSAILYLFVPDPGIAENGQVSRDTAAEERSRGA